MTIRCPVPVTPALKAWAFAFAARSLRASLVRCHIPEGPEWYGVTYLETRALETLTLRTPVFAHDDDPPLPPDRARATGAA